MAFREKMKRALRRSVSDGSDLTSTESNKTKKPKKEKKEKYPDNVYKPGEAMPRLKYRGPYNKVHQDKLSAFSFGDAWKRRKSSLSANSDMSPMGSRRMSRRGSTWSNWTKKTPLGSRKNSGFAGVEESGEGDDDVANVGLSRQQTAENRRPRTGEQPREMASLIKDKTITNGDMNGLEAQKTITNGKPFTEEELAYAMTQSTLKPSRRERD